MNIRLAVIMAVSVLVGGCTTLQGPDYGVFDPYENGNRVSYKVTDSVDKKILVPVAGGYDALTPRWLARGILGVFQNFRNVDSFVNGLLQGKPKSAVTDLTRIVVNTTVGLGGFFDVAAGMDLPFQDEDLGQTFAVWGVKKSRYAFIPFFGPTTLRDMPATAVRSLLPGLLLGSAYHWTMTGLDVISARADLLNASRARDASALDPYAFTRDAYYQRRTFQIYDGQPPLDDFFDDFDEIDE